MRPLAVFAPCAMVRLESLSVEIPTVEAASCIAPLVATSILPRSFRPRQIIGISISITTGISMDSGGQYFVRKLPEICAPLSAFERQVEHVDDAGLLAAGNACACVPRALRALTGGPVVVVARR